jgi:hypothetical protein
MSRMVRNERGMALALVIMMLVIVGGLIAGVVFASMQDQRSAESERPREKAFSVAEKGAWAQVRGWNTTWNSLPTYQNGSATGAISATQVPGLGSYSGAVYHVSPSEYLVDVTGGDSLGQAGAVPGGGGRARVGLIMRLIPSTPLLKGAITTRGGTGDFRGGYKVSGFDSIPHGWAGCGPTQPSVTGFVTNDTAHFTGKSTSNITGTASPVKPWNQDTTLTTAKMDTIGNTTTTYTSLAAMATVTLPGGSYLPAPVSFAGVCTTSVTTNWGDTLQTNPCGDYFPIVHITGNLSAHGGSGQGILLVDGDATLLNFTWFGMVIIQGALAPQTDSTHFFKVTGGLQMNNKNNVSQDVWDINAKYSSCALAKVFAQIPAGVSGLRSRGWAELY